MMRNICLLLTIFCSITAYSVRGTVNIECVESTSKVYIYSDKAETIKLAEFPKGRCSYEYDVNPTKTVYVKMILNNGIEYIKKPYKLIAGSENNICMGLANIDGFYDTDREQLNKVTEEVIKKLGRKNGKLKDIEVWLIKAIKDIQTVPQKK
jgi:hypothetical protein